MTGGLSLTRRRSTLDAMSSIERRTVLGGIGAVVASNAQTRPSASGLHYDSLLEVADRIRRKEVSPVELAHSQLDRIDQLDPKLNAYQLVLRERAMARARQAEAEITAGNYRGPLHGVPIAVKDLLFVKGVATKGGCKALASFVPDYDATVVRRLESAGAIILGKLNLNEGAMAGYHRDFAVPRNPWDANRTPGLSSSGSGVATAAGIAYGTIGTDTGGSIRYPSSANGVVGLKPTYGRVSRRGVLGLAPSLDHVGPMSRRVADAAAMLSAMAGEDPDDPTSLSAAVPDFAKELNKGVKGMRIGFDDKYATAAIPQYMADAIRRAVRELEKAGASVVEVKLPDMDENVLAPWFVLTGVEAAMEHARTFPSRAGDYGVFFRMLLENGSKTPAVEYAKAATTRAEFNGRLRRAFAKFDVLACPSTVGEAPAYDPAQAYGGQDTAAGTVCGVPLSWLGGSGRFTTPYNYSGYPTLSLPCGFSPDGLPLSLQLVGRPLAEDLVCRAGFAYESATDWHRRHPPV